MVTCPSCKTQLLEGSFFCPECGSQIVPVDRMSTQSIRRDTTGRLRPPGVPISDESAEQGASQEREVLISVNLVDTGQVLRLRGLPQYVLGRSADGSPAVPDVDLAPFDAFAQGVSRQHALVKVAGQRVYIMDLGSSNGTRINGQKINPHVEFPLNHGDMIALGKFKIQFLVRK